MFQIFRLLERFLGNLVDRVLDRLRPSWSIKLTREGFGVHKDGDVIAAVSWADITEVHAFKRDCITTDLICFEFKIRSRTDIVCEVNEDMTGFTELVAELERVFPAFDKYWRGKVVQPAFAENRTVVYRKPS